MPRAARARRRWAPAAVVVGAVALLAATSGRGGARRAALDALPLPQAPSSSGRAGAASSDISRAMGADDDAAATAAATAAAARAGDDDDDGVGASAADALANRSTGTTMLFKHTRPTDKLFEDADFVEAYFCDYASSGAEASKNRCERSAKFATRNFALHLVDSNATLPGPANLSHWYAQVRAQPTRAQAAEGIFLEAYDVFLDDATVFYVDNLTAHAYALLNAATGKFAGSTRLLARSYARATTSGGAAAASASSSPRARVSARYDGETSTASAASALVLREARRAAGSLSSMSGGDADSCIGDAMARLDAKNWIRIRF